MRRGIVAALALAVLASGCGGGGVSVDPGNPDDPGDPGTRVWTYTPGSTSTLGAWAGNVGGTVTGTDISVVLRGDGQVTVTSYGAVTGSTSGTADEDGVFSTTTGTIRANGTAGRDSIHVSIWLPTSPMVKTTMNTTTLATGSYSACLGAWTGTYSIAGGTAHAFTFRVDETGFVTGTIADGEAAGPVYGTIDPDGTVRITQPYRDAGHPGWIIDGTATSGGASGTVRSLNVLDERTGTWTVTKG